MGVGEPLKAPRRSGETLRTLGHVGAGFGALLLRPWGAGPVLVLVLAGLAVALALPERWAVGIGGPAAHRSWRWNWGPAAYPLAVALLLTFLFSRPAIVAAVWAMLAAGDAAAFLVGRRRGRHGLPWNRDKSWEGSFAYLFAGGAAAWAAGTWTAGTPADPRWLLPVLLATGLAALLEGLRLPVDDNLLPPLAAGGLLALLLVPAVAAGPAAAPGVVAGVAGVHLLLGLAAAVLGWVSSGGALLGAALGTTVALVAGPRAWILFAATVGLGFVVSLSGPRSGSPAPWRSRERRHAGQVAAKGAVAVVLWGLAARRGFPAVAVMAAGAATAAAVADTLASEIGRRSRWPPRMLGSGQVVAAGTPGAVSWIGSLAALLGAAALAVATALLGLLPWGGVPATAVAALVAVFAESLLAGDGPATRHDPVAANLMLGLLAALLAAAIGTIQSWIH